MSTIVLIDDGGSLTPMASWARHLGHEPATVDCASAIDRCARGQVALVVVPLDQMHLQHLSAIARLNEVAPDVPVIGVLPADPSERHRIASFANALRIRASLSHPLAFAAVSEVFERFLGPAPTGAMQPPDAPDAACCYERFDREASTASSQSPEERLGVDVGATLSELRRAFHARSDALASEQSRRHSPASQRNLDRLRELTTQAYLQLRRDAELRRRSTSVTRQASNAVSATERAEEASRLGAVARAAAILGYYPAAVRMLKHAVTLTPGDKGLRAQLELNLGLALAERGQEHAAETAFRHAEVLAPEDAQAHAAIEFMRAHHGAQRRANGALRALFDELT